MISLNNISHSYGVKKIFENFSLEVNKGEFLVIYGPSGRRKTTLLNIMSLLEQPDNGDVTINGQ